MDISGWATVAAGVVATALGLRAWLKGLFNRMIPGPARTMLAVANIVNFKRRPLDNRFRFVLCWLEGDCLDGNDEGRDTETVARAFRDISGVELVRSARIVKAEGAGDDWRPAMREQANAILLDWRGDLAIIGAVERPGENLSLWFVPRRGDGTLRRIEQQFALKGAMLGEDFREALHEQIAAVALSAVTPLASDAARGRVLEDGLKQAVGKLDIMLGSGEITAPRQRADLREAYGAALFALGERESGTARLEEAVAAYREALKERTRENAPLNWAATQNDLGVALTSIGEREGGTAKLEEAIEAYREALKERTRENAPLNWAATQNNIGTVLTRIGERESETTWLEEAIVAYREALKEYTRERAPFNWAATQSNLGHALTHIGERESETSRLEEAAAAYDNALTVFDSVQTLRYWEISSSSLEKVRAIIRQRSEEPR